MRVLLVLKESTMHERLGVMYLSSALKSHGHDVRLVLVDRIGLEGLRNLMDSYQPVVVGYSAMTGEHMGLIEINRVLKEDYKFLAVFGGPHATFFPDLIKEYRCDAICIGEGDIAFPEFCRRVDQSEAYWETPNFIVKFDGKIVNNPPSPLVENLDNLPFPDRGIMYEADPHLLNEGKKIFFATRGCPYKCTYCFNSKYNETYHGKGKILRHRSSENLIDEICSVQEHYRVDTVWLDDDTFLLKSRDWFRSFSMLYKERVKLPLVCNVRANLVTEEVIALLKDAGLDAVYMGIECGNEDIANKVLKRELKNKQLLIASDIIKSHGIKLITQSLIGLPVPDSYRTDLQTLDLNIKIRPLFAWSSILYPYPGTPVELYARTHGFLEGEVPFLETNKRFSVFNFPKEEKKKIEHLHKLFGLIVHFPFLRRYCNFLVQLPLGNLYAALFYLWYGYNDKFKIFPFWSLRKELGNYIKLWWKFVRKN